MAVLERHQDLVEELIAEVEAYKPDVDRELLDARVRLRGRAPTPGRCASRARSSSTTRGARRRSWPACSSTRRRSPPRCCTTSSRTPASTIDELRAEFGDEIAKLVEGVTKLTRVQFQSREHAEAENYRKLIVAMAEDVRVILIKLADRLHNLRTIEYLGKQKQLQKARETLEVYAPLAHRLGIHALKWELEDLSFQTLHPRKYEEIKQMVAERRADREEHVREAAMVLQKELDKVDIPAEISGRAKHFYSIYDKMAKKGREFNEIYDLTAMRVIVERGGDEGTRDCYGALGLIHSLWKPMPGRFKDYIAMPKFNGYRALHTTVIGPQGRPLEIQVRTREMHETAEFGVAAHWLTSAAGSDKDAEWVAWVKQLMDEGTTDEADPREFMKTFRTDLFDEEVHVFTPKGQVKTLPAGSTPIDFAYAVHTDVGHRTVGAKINGRIVPLHYTLQERRLRRDPHVEAGARAVARLAVAREELAGAQQDPPVVLARDARGRRAEGARGARAGAEGAEPAVREAARLGDARAGDPRDGLQEGGGLLPRARLGEAAAGRDRQQGHSAAEDRAGRRGGAGRHEGAEARETVSGTDMGVSSPGVDDVLVRLAKCCTPVPGDEIVGYISLGRGITIHRDDCPNVKALRRNPERFTPVVVGRRDRREELPRADRRRLVGSPAPARGRRPDVCRARREHRQLRRRRRGSAGEELVHGRGRRREACARCSRRCGTSKRSSTPTA